MPNPLSEPRPLASAQYTIFPGASTGAITNVVRAGRGDRRLHGPGSGKAKRLDGHADRHVVDRRAQPGPQVLVERVAAIARVGPQRVSEAGHGHRHLEQVLAPGGKVIEARPQPVARHQRRRFGRRDAGRAAGGPVSAEQRGRARRDRGIDEDRIGWEVRERRRWRAPRAADAAGPHDDEASAAAGAARRNFPRRRRPDFLRRPPRRSMAATIRPSRKPTRRCLPGWRRCGLTPFETCSCCSLQQPPTAVSEYSETVTIAPGRISVNRHGNHLPRRICRLRANSPVLACDAADGGGMRRLLFVVVSGRLGIAGNTSVHCRLPVEPATMFDRRLRAHWLGEKRDVLVKWSRLFWIFVLSGAVLIGGAAWLSAHWLSAPGVPAAKEERVAADLGSTRARPGRPAGGAPRRRGPRTRPPSPPGIRPHRAPPRRALRVSRASRRRPRARTDPRTRQRWRRTRPLLRPAAPARRTQSGSTPRPASRCGARGTSFPTGAVPTSPSAAGRCARRGSFAAARPRAAAAPTRWPDRAARASARNKRAINPQRINSQ